MAVRKVVTRSGGHSRGLSPSIKNPIVAAWESQGEQGFERLLELSPLVREYTVQPVREPIVVAGIPSIYIPDVTLAGDVCRWVLTYRLTRCVVRLVPHHWQKGRKAVIEGDIEEMLLDVINEEYLKPERASILKVWREFKDRIEQHNRDAAPSARLELPSRSSVYRYVERLDPYLADRARFGKRVADLNSRVAATEMQVRQILDCWEIDHTLLDVLVFDPETGKVIGRPYLNERSSDHSIILAKAS